MRGMGASAQVSAPASAQASAQVSAPRPVERVGFFRSLWRAVRAVFHETTGTLFFLIALSWLNAAIRMWRQGGTAHWVFAVCGVFIGMLIVFGLTSFRAARRVR
jgi:hypothetical protein